MAEIWELMDSYKFFSCTIFILQAHYGKDFGLDAITDLIALICLRKKYKDS